MATIVTPLGEFTIDTAGTAEQLSSTVLETSAIMIEADSLNTGKVYIGLSDVDEDKYITALSPGEVLTMTASLQRGTDEALYINDYYADTENDGNTVHISYQHRRR